MNAITEGKHTRASIGVYDSDSLLTCSMLEEAFLRAVIRRTGQAGKIEQDRDLVVWVLYCLWREI